MARIRHGISHLDHGLPPEAIKVIEDAIKDLKAFTILTITVSGTGVGPMLCKLHGPITGEEVVLEEECRMVRRGTREWESRMCDRPPVLTDQVTIIVGPYANVDDGPGYEEIILFTAYPGPLAPREPGDPSIQADEGLILESQDFWAHHALSD